MRLLGATEGLLNPLAAVVPDLSQINIGAGSGATALGDPSLEVAFPVAPSQGGWMDSSGRAMMLPKLGSGRSVSDVRHEGHMVAALVHDDALDTNPRLLDAATAMAGSRV